MINEDYQPGIQLFSGTFIMPKAGKMYATYMHSINSPNGQVPMWIGVCEIRRVFEYPDARHNTEWLRMLGDHTFDLIITIFGTATNKIDALRYASAMIRRHQPYCNLNGRMIAVSGSKVIITCVETGQSWPTMSAAAKAIGVSSAMLSKHLNGQKGYGSVKGQHYMRGVMQAGAQHQSAAPLPEHYIDEDGDD